MSIKISEEPHRKKPKKPFRCIIIEKVIYTLYIIFSNKF